MSDNTASEIRKMIQQEFQNIQRTKEDVSDLAPTLKLVRNSRSGANNEFRFRVREPSEDWSDRLVSNLPESVQVALIWSLANKQS